MRRRTSVFVGTLGCALLASCGSDRPEGRVAYAVPDVPVDVVVRRYDDTAARSADGLSETRRASELGPTGATFAGAVNPKGRPTKYWFEYGPTTAYGSATPVREVPPKLAAHYAESWSKDTANWRGGVTGDDLSYLATGYRDGAVRFTEPSGIDANHADGIGENQLCQYAWIGSYYPGTAAEPAFFGGGDPDLRDARIRVVVRGNQWVANGSELAFWMQADTDLAKQSNDNLAKRANWAYTGTFLTDALLSGQWQTVEYRLENDPSRWSYAGAQLELADQPRYVYQPLDTTLGHLNNDIFHMLVFVDSTKVPSGSIDFDELEITYRNHSLVFPGNGGRLVSAPAGADDASTLTDGWRNGAGHTWKSAASPSGPLEIEYELANPVSIRAVQIHQNPEWPSKEIEVLVSTDGVEFTRLSGGADTPAILPQAAKGGANFAYYLDDATRRRLVFGASAPAFPATQGVRRVKVRILSGYQSQYWGLGEIELFGTGATNVETDDDWVTLSEDVKGFAPGVPLHYRLVTESAAGRSFAGDKVYDVPKDARPIAYTRLPRGIAAGAATVEGRIGALGSRTTYYFVYGDGTTSQRTDPADAGVEGTARTVTAALRGLVPGKTYRYQLVAENEKGTSYGEELTFVAK